MFTRKLIRAGLLSFAVLIINIGISQNEIAVSNISKVIADSTTSDQLYFTSDSLQNSRATKFVNAYLKKNKYGLTQLKKRSQSSLAVISSIFIKHDIPVELKYLAVVESGLKSSLSSHCGAVGFWQI